LAPLFGFFKLLCMSMKEMKIRMKLSIGIKNSILFSYQINSYFIDNDTTDNQRNSKKEGNT